MMTMMMAVGVIRTGVLLAMIRIGVLPILEGLMTLVAVQVAFGIVILTVVLIWLVDSIIRINFGLLVVGLTNNRFDFVLI